MTTSVAALPDAGADIRWRDWQARGAEGDRRRATIAGRLMVVIAVALALALFGQLV
jgi:hypothetical protein